MAKKMKKQMVMVLAAAVAAIGLTACGGNGKNTAGDTKAGDSKAADTQAASSGGDTFTLKIGNTVSDIDPFNVAYTEFKKSVEEESGGKIKVEIFSNGSIGETDADVLDKVRSNTLQMGNTTPNCLAALADMPEYYVYGIPYLMSTDEELNKIGESEWIDGLNQDFQKATGVKIFEGGGVNMGWFGFSLTKGDINQISDLKGKSIRINQTNQMISLTEGVGISPQFIAFSEVYTALAQGTVDGMVTNVPLFYSNGFYDQLKSILTTHCGESYHFYIMNEAFYNGLPEDLQKVLDENVAKLIDRTRELETDYLQETITAMTEKGVKVTEASAEDEENLKNISIEKVWWDEAVSLTPADNVNKVLEILGRTDEMK